MTPDELRQAAAEIAALPELPRPAITFADHSYPAFSKRQMEDYARSAIAAQAERIRQLEERVGAGGYCAFCETVIPAMPGFLLSHVMRGHVETCPKHPLAQALAKIAELEQQLGECSGGFETQEKEITALRIDRDRAIGLSDKRERELRATIASQAAAICVLAAMVPEGATLNAPADITNTIRAAMAAKGSGT